MFDTLRMIRTAADVRRYHTARVIGEQTVGHHSFNVAMLVRLITEDAASAELLRAALNHDIPEAVTGDIPAPVKWKSEKISEGLFELEQEFIVKHGGFFQDQLTEDERRVLTVADTLELVLFCEDQARLGNQHLEPIGNAGRGALRRKLRPENRVWAANIETLIGGVE
jgi:5'-deoxynucleotidase YfbR-like HD superfamily hydrolase